MSDKMPSRDRPAAELSSAVRPCLRTTCHILICGIMVLLASCAPAPAPPSPATDSAMTPPSVEECQAKGGTIRNVCRRQLPACVVPYPDGGKRCTDNAQCKGKCLVDTGTDGSSEPGGSVEGKCQQDNDPCGCKIEVVNGKVAGGACVD
jgi:hypothetical protein